MAKRTDFHGNVPQSCEVGGQSRWNFKTVLNPLILFLIHHKKGIKQDGQRADAGNCTV